MLPGVMVGCPVRDRGWILPRYLAALAALDHPALDFCFVVNDCTDQTPFLLAAWAQERPGCVTLIRHDFGPAATPSPERGHYGRDRYARLAELRNRLLEAFLDSDAGYLLSVDSDILLPPDAVTRLLAAGRPLVAAVVRNDGHLGPDLDRPYYNAGRLVDGRWRHLRELPDAEVFPVDLTGAAILIRRDVAEAGVRWGPHPGGEDQAFCEAAREAGYGLWCHQGVRPEHVMLRPPGPL